MGPIINKVLYPVILGLVGSALTWLAANLPGASDSLDVAAATAAITAVIMGVIGYLVPLSQAKVTDYFAAKGVTLPGTPTTDSHDPVGNLAEPPPGSRVSPTNVDNVTTTGNPSGNPNVTWEHRDTPR